MELYECLIKVADESSKPGMLSSMGNAVKGMGINAGVAFKNQAPAVAGGLAASMAVAKGLQGVQGLMPGDGGANKYWKKFIEKYPEYHNDEKAREFFDVMMDSNPSMAKHPIMVKSFLQTTYDHADAINPDTIKTLSSVEKNMVDIDDKKNQLTRTVNDNFSKALDRMKDAPLDAGRYVGQNLQNAKTYLGLIQDYKPERVDDIVHHGL